MKPAPIPENEPERLDALYRLLILDTPPEERFDRIVGFAAEEFDAPMAQLTLLDRDRQWFKSRVGLEGCEASRKDSFCGHILDNPEGLIVKDATLDERFHDNPFVTGDVGLRFYAGTPLVLPDGHIVGALCVMDNQPREFDATDLIILRKLRDLVVNELLQSGPRAG
jgi:GAF domain-containing protein